MLWNRVKYPLKNFIFLNLQQLAKLITQAKQ